MKSVKSLLCLVLLGVTYYLNSQTNASVAYNYDADGNRTSLNYIITRVTENEIFNDTVRDVMNSEDEEYPFDISVYPNPTSGYLVLSTNYHENTLPVHVVLYSIQGNIMEDRVIDSDFMEFNLSDYSAGVYLLSVMYEDKRDLWKIVKK